MSVLGMTNGRRKRLWFLGIPLVFSLLALLSVVVSTGVFRGSSDAVEAQGVPNSSMDQRLELIINSILEASDPAVADQAIASGMNILYGGLRPLPSPGAPETEEADKAIGAAELRFAAALQQYAFRSNAQGDQRARALDLKLFIEEMNEVAAAVGAITRDCGEGALIGDGEQLDSPCNDLVPLLDEENGELTPLQLASPIVLRPGYSVKLRSPVVPRNTTLRWDEDVITTEPLAPGECAVVLKETRGLMLRLHFDRIIVVTDPWVGVFNFPRQTRIPIWRLEWVPSEYVKTWNICNRDGETRNSHQQIVKQDHALNFFWRYYPAASR